MGSIKCIFTILYIEGSRKRDQKQDEREKNYQEIISKITDKLAIVEVVKRC